MLDFYFAALLGGGRLGGLALLALPDALTRPDREARRAGRDRRAQLPATPADHGQARAPVDAPVTAGPDGSSGWNPCPCRQWGVGRDDRHGCVTLCKELFPELDQELDAWERAHGWLYR